MFWLLFCQICFSLSPQISSSPATVWPGQSLCGLTNTNYTELTKLYEKCKDQGLTILAFPCNHFGSQEPGTNEQIQEFACTRFKAEYPIFDKCKHRWTERYEAHLWDKTYMEQLSEQERKTNVGVSELFSQKVMAWLRIDPNFMHYVDFFPKGNGMVERIANEINLQYNAGLASESVSFSLGTLKLSQEAENARHQFCLKRFIYKGF